MKVGKDEWRETERGEQNFKRKKRENMVCRNLPYDGSVGEKPKERLPKRRTRGSRHHCSFEENVSGDGDVRTTTMVVVMVVATTLVVVVVTVALMVVVVMITVLVVVVIAMLVATRYGGDNNGDGGNNDGSDIGGGGGHGDNGRGIINFR